MKKLLKNKKGYAGLEMFGKLGIAVVGLAIILAVGFLIVAQVRTQIGTAEGIDMTNASQRATSVALNGTQTMAVALDGIPGWIPIVIIVVIGATLISLVKLFKQ